MSRNVILTVCLVIVGGGLGYYFFFYNGDTSSALTTTGSSASDAEVAFIALVGKLDPIVFDTTLLSDPRFVSRNDIKTTIVPEATGRRDPFAPIGR